ncbi:tail fiber domain-containing protein [Ichthyenterobacterium sp. W332]|uniref:Tail fiber domain-containing protein n=1 Tax=Microcosmobacter mediterraneus TaxID=3075607 RepID=A0ABU2YFX3_9FLAO|nr:tail fiber domain-containing protein [Ichthyenterobacterium sp. W332]MDT0557079.1 tail fiber domain-containing protein [Ichthyenterobacterium sp. W332]
MKIKILLLIILLTSITSYSQNGISYKALIKNNLGNVVANQTIDIRFTILVDGAAGDYIEKHSIATNANGIITVTIGQGDMVLQGDFLTIDWTTNITLLKTEIDIEQDGTYLEMGIEPFKFVPYAIQAISAIEADVAKNVTGLEYIDETDDDVDNGGWRLVGVNSGSHGDLGINAVDLSIQSVGTNQGATGNYSFAFGIHTEASGSNSVAFGDASKALGSNSISFGLSNEASGSTSIAIGNNSKALGFHSIALGTSAEATVNYAIALGRNTKSTGTHSTTMGNDTEASGFSSTAMGENTIASGDYSTALGRNTVAFDLETFASGTSTIASGPSSTALGNNTTAVGTNSTSMGIHTIATAYASTAIGKFSEVDASGLFIVGNGTSEAIADRHNAFIIKTDGKVGVNTTNPASLFEVLHDNVLPTPGNRANALSIRNSSTANSVQLATHSNGSLTLYTNGNYLGYFNNTSGAYVAVSDRKLKKDIIVIENGTLNKVLQLNPVTYLMKDQTDTNRNHGLISQEVREIFPSITHYVKESDLLTLSYTELIPILIKAIQEQQEIIETQRLSISEEKNTNKKQNEMLQALLTRIEVVENNISN